MSRIIEILLYRLRPGAGGAFFTVMQDISVPLHRAQGIDVVWHGQSLHDPDAYGLIRAFADLPGMEATQAAFYASDAWRDGPRATIIAAIETATKLVVPMNDEAIAGLRRQGWFQAG